MATTTTTVPLVTVPVGALVRIDYPRWETTVRQYDERGYVTNCETVVIAEPSTVIGFRTETETGMAMLRNDGIELHLVDGSGTHNAGRYTPVTILCDCEPTGPASRCGCDHW